MEKLFKQLENNSHHRWNCKFEIAGSPKGDAVITINFKDKEYELIRTLKLSDRTNKEGYRWQKREFVYTLISEEKKVPLSVLKGIKIIPNEAKINWNKEKNYNEAIKEMKQRQFDSEDWKL